MIRLRLIKSSSIPSSRNSGERTIILQTCSTPHCLEDGPQSLTDMLSIPEEFKALVADYRMHLLQLRDSEALHFRDPDVHTVFEISRRIYQRDYEGIESLYQHSELSTEVGLVIGAITSSQQLIHYSLQAEREGGGVNMCTALEELRKEGIEEGIKEGEVKGAIRTCRQVGLNRESTLELLAKEFHLSDEKVAASMEKYW